MEPTTRSAQGTLPPPPPLALAGVVHSKAPEMQRTPMARRGIGKKGQPIKLLTNHFDVKVANTDGYFFHYSVSITYEDGTPVDAKGIGRRVLERVRETYENQLSRKNFAYDGEKSLFTVGPLPSNINEFTVVMEDTSSNRNAGHGSPEGGGNGSPSDRKRIRRQPRSKTYKVSINYATKIPMQAIANALRGIDSEHFQEAVRVLDIILRQHAAKQGCLLVRQSFFQNNPRNFVDLKGGVLGCRGFHASFRPTQNGLSLNMDVSTTMIVRPGPVIPFLVENQNVTDPYRIDWVKAKRMLRNLIVTNTVTKLDQKVTGLSDKKCKEQTFLMKPRKEDGDSQRPREITVYEYYVNHRNIPLRSSGDFPCINVGKPKRPTFIPLELCTLVSLQRYTKALSSQQRASLVESSRQRPQERKKIVEDAMKSSNYNADILLESSRVHISDQLTSVNGRLLSAPKLKVGNGEDCLPKNGRWNFNNKKLVEPVRIESWAVVNFSARADLPRLVRDLTRCGAAKGISFAPPCPRYFEEKPALRRAPPAVRVEKMFEYLMEVLPRDKPPEFLLCILPERKNSDLYGPWKRKNLSDFGIVTQCIAPTKINDQYLTNVVLKINAKMGGINSLLACEKENKLPVVCRAPTIIIGMDVSHGSPGRADVPSIAAVVSSRGWPLISRYRAEVRTQPPKTEMIESLYKEISETKDDGKTVTKDKGVFRELLVDFFQSSKGKKPEQIIIFRDGVSESQFNQVLNKEFNQILKACEHLDETWKPKFTLLVAQKNHHTKFFQVGPNSNYNVPPGTVVDTGICHPRNNDFYICAHAGMIGTSRPTHYHVLHDDIGFQADELQELVNSLSYVYQRSTTAISVVAPICYAHLAASQVSQFIKFDDLSDTSSSNSGVTSTARAVPELPKLNENVSSSMFFC